MLSWSEVGGVAEVMDIPGVLGRSDARAGGVPTALLGGALHFFIAGCMVGAYYLLSGPVPMLRRQPVLWGAIYGTAAFFVMNCVVIPLSAAPTPKLDFSSGWLWMSIVAHAILVGIPAGVFAARARR